VEGLETLVYLPNKEGASKPKKAIIKCERGSNIIQCEVKAGGQKRKLKFDVFEVVSLQKVLYLVVSTLQ